MPKDNRKRNWKPHNKMNNFNSRRGFGQSYDYVENFDSYQYCYNPMPSRGNNTYVNSNSVNSSYVNNVYGNNSYANNSFANNSYANNSYCYDFSANNSHRNNLSTNKSYANHFFKNNSYGNDSSLNNSNRNNFSTNKIYGNDSSVNNSYRNNFSTNKSYGNDSSKNNSNGNDSSVNNTSANNSFVNNYKNTYKVSPIEKRADVSATASNSKESKIVKKINLYKRPELHPDDLNGYQDDEVSYSPNDMRYWQKPKEENTDRIESRRQKRKEKKGKNVIDNFSKMLMKPVDMSKGKSLLEKMGWTGGGLGKDGAGIVEPIRPKMKYAAKTLGLGHEDKPEKKEKVVEEAKFSNNFRTNILLQIQEFVKNDSQVELLFETTLLNSERKRIHMIVEELRECQDVDDLSYQKPLDLEIARDILKRNRYILTTESCGKKKNRQLGLYKDAPEHIYLIIPDDFEDEEDEKKCKENDKSDNQKPKSELENVKEESNEDIEVKNNEANIKEQDSTSTIKSTSENKIGANSDAIVNDDISSNGLENLNKYEKVLDVNNSATEVNENINSEEDSKKVTSEFAAKNSTENERVLEVIINSNIELSEQLNVKQDSGNVTESVNEITEDLQNSNTKAEEQLNSEENSENTKKGSLSKIVNFFKEFAKDSSYTEFRFLGAFDDEQLYAVETFFDIGLKKNVDVEEKDELLEALCNELFEFEIMKDENGSTFVSKIKKTQQLRCK